MSPTIYFIQGDDLAYSVAVTNTNLATRTSNSTTLVGTNTSWTSALDGQNITFSDGTTNVIESVTSTTELTLETAPTVSDSSPQSVQIAQNITGWTIYFTVKTNLVVDSDTNAIIQVNVTNHTNATQGLSSIPLTDSLTNVTPGTYFYDVRTMNSGGHIVSARYGQCIIYPGIGQRMIS